MSKIQTLHQQLKAIILFAQNTPTPDSDASKPSQKKPPPEGEGSKFELNQSTARAKETLSEDSETELNWFTD
jgi:hypothetical protein